MSARVSAKIVAAKAEIIRDMVARIRTFRRDGVHIWQRSGRGFVIRYDRSDPVRETSDGASDQHPCREAT